jgi:enamine deaminase RidA (YjgF/YER057c/UK114 family)
MKVLQPPGWPRPKGYANGVSARGRTLFTGGMIGWDDQQHFHSPDLVDQFAQALRNVLLVLAEDDAGSPHIVRLTVYVTDMATYRASLGDMGTVWREIMGRNYPAMALVEVKSLVEPSAVVEVEATAVVEE